MARQITTLSGQSNFDMPHEIVQHALRSAAVASTPNDAIDVLGEALLELEKMMAVSRAQAH